MVRRALPVVTVLALLLVGSSVSTSPQAQPARISESVQTIPTYPFSEPNAIPILARDPRLYPYHSFEGYAHKAEPRPWKVVHLQNDWIEVFVLPEVGGKVWGARVRKSGHEFIYRNEVLKFRNIALRGPWTSGGIEFNFGVIGHTPSTATPVDYALRRNPDGSVSCIVGTMDLPSRTEWRVEIRLPADRAAFDTNVLWHNPTPLEQPYYNWMTAAAFAKDDLEMSIPGNAYLQHSGAREAWPVDDRGRFLPVYRNNAFGPSKSYHVVGELQDFFGGYYRDAGYGFGHWARHEEMPGQKLWLWALSRSGGIWEDLLTDTDGQYVEFQAGRLLVQYAPGGDVNPIRQAGFDPFATDRWTETWFPLEGLGGLTEASRDGAIAVREADGDLRIGVTAFRQTSDMLRVWSGDTLLLQQPIAVAPLEPVSFRVAHQPGAPYRVELRALGIDYSSSPADRTLSRPFETDPAAMPSLPEADRAVFEAQELIRGRRYGIARPMLEEVLAKQPWHRNALLALGDLEYRRARYAEGLAHATKALQINAYDAEANFTAGNLYRALGKTADAREAFGWAARSMAYRTAANVQLAELALARSDWGEAERYARIALDYNRLNLSAWDILAIVGRRTANRSLVEATMAQLLELDPLHHFVRAEAYLAAPTPATLAALTDGLRSEYPDQAILELAIGYVNRGLTTDAIALLEATRARITNPLLRTWLAHLRKDASSLAQPADVAFVFPYRRETLPVLTWAAGQSPHWSWRYLRALNLWALDRAEEAHALLGPLRNSPDVAAFYAARASLTSLLAQGDPEPDLLEAERRSGRDLNACLPLIRYYRQTQRWADGLAASTRLRTRFPNDFRLDLLHARFLVQSGRASEAIAILNATRVLPSEGASDSHPIHVQAHLLAAFAAIDVSRWDDASSHLTAALDWPEHLGQGRPYDPEERLIRFLIGHVEERRGRAAEATRAFEAVVASTAPGGGGLARLDLLAIPALRALGRAGDIDRIVMAAAARPGTDPVVRETAHALARSESIAAIVAANPRPPGDLDGTLLVRALSLAGR